MSCLGCDLANAKLPVHTIYENELVHCFLDIDPFNEGHTLILPKRHVKELTELTNEETFAVMEAAKYISEKLNMCLTPDGITINQNGGKFSDLTHFHMHVIPRFENDGFTWSESLIEDDADQRLAETADKLRSV
ncbi:HIT family hydrolase [Fictibacillus phosphorivorans]|uniref:HIT family hydrolase n=1 Tax=Fictibacillus phosphorivorans TaxID=1221500 RepID=A0A165P3F1_9BACL|nr:HIT family protein [Fictibacillus phosphorivorans]KZE68853.1 HIT family hydrolase [Fictibacillus phosphorivorans]